MGGHQGQSIGGLYSGQAPPFMDVRHLPGPSALLSLPRPQTCGLSLVLALFLEHTPGGVGACTLWRLALHACLLSSFHRGGGWGPEGGAVQGGRWGCRALTRELDPPCTVLQGGPRQALKGSPSPTASPDWEPLKEHLEHGRQAN